MSDNTRGGSDDSSSTSNWKACGLVAVIVVACSVLFCVGTAGVMGWAIDREMDERYRESVEELEASVDAGDWKAAKEAHREIASLRPNAPILDKYRDQIREHAPDEPEGGSDKPEPPTEGNTTPFSGEIGYLYAESSCMAMIARSEVAFDKYVQAAVKNDKAGAAQLEQRGHVKRHVVGTKVRVLEMTGVDQLKVRLLEGPWKGNLGWALADQVVGEEPDKTCGSYNE